MLIRQYARHETERMQSDFGNTVKQCVYMIEKLSNRLREVHPKDAVSSQMCWEADKYLNALTLLKDDKTFYPQRSQRRMGIC
jgi:hypothetical protein